MEVEISRLQSRLRFEAGERRVLRWRDLRRIQGLEWGWECWVTFVRDLNAARMKADASQWTLHAQANAARDLQAWYHATFAGELYRLRGSFWYKEAVLPAYDAHPICRDDNSTTSPGDVLSSPNAIYTAMAATMYTIRATLSEEAYALFERFTTGGVTVLKHPFRAGKPQKKRFQLSLVQGDLYLYMYLTWKGKHGMQGIELASVDRVVPGVETDVLKRTANRRDADCYLSLVTLDRSLDLCFETRLDRDLWTSAMTELVRIEKEVRANSLGGAPPTIPPPALKEDDEEDDDATVVVAAAAEDGAA